MSDIYSLARRVVIWLGEAANDSTHAMETLRYLSDQVECLVDGHIDNAPGATEFPWWKPRYPLSYEPRTWDSLTSLFCRPWFDRVWVLQEAQLGGRRALVQCGTDCIPWSTLRKAIFALLGKIDVPTELDSFFFEYLGGVKGREFTSLPELLQWSRLRRCTEPRDKVYGILSLCPPGIRMRLEPQYSLSITQVYLDVFLAHLSMAKRLDLLRHCRIDQQLEDSPSWLPNWGVRLQSFRGDNRRNQMRQASGLSPAEARYSYPNVLDAVGVRRGQICSVGNVASGGASRFVQVLRESEPDDLDTSDYVTGETRLDAFLEVLVQGRTRERYPGNARFMPIAELRSVYRTVAYDSPSDPRIANSISVSAYDDGVFMRTDDGYYGIGPKAVQKGDQVCVLLGCDKPMVLRPSTDPETYLVVGPCFVHGLMDGEALLGSFPEPWKQQWENIGGVWTAFFSDGRGRTVCTDDPRLSALPSNWVENKRERTQNDGACFREFYNKDTGECINYDPRMSSMTLQLRKVKLDTFRLI